MAKEIKIEPVPAEVFPELTKLQRRLVWASVLVMWAGIAFVAWLAWGMMQVLGYR